MPIILLWLISGAIYRVWKYNRSMVLDGQRCDLSCRNTTAKIKMIYRLCAIFCLCFLSVVSAKAQTWCGAEWSGSLEPVTEMPTREKMEITVPVVVHVVWRTEEQRPDEDRVRSQIDVLNEDFRKLNSDISDVYPLFRGRAADLEINFVLATEDPQGQAHPGIITRQTTDANIAALAPDGRRKLCYDDLGGSSAWCTECYLNIWVADLGLEAVAGIGIFPTQIASGEVPGAEDGVYIQPGRFGRDDNLEEPYHLGRTCTHEVGHYFNLLHPWGAETPPADCIPSVCCDDPAYDDAVDDTPSQISLYVGECPGVTVNSCISSPVEEPDNAQNFMGFSADNCSLMFTEGQKIRVWDAIATYRTGFLADDCLKSCLVNTANEPVLVDDLFRILRNGSSQPRLQVLTDGLQWELYGINGQIMQSGQQNQAGELALSYSNLAAGVYLLQARKGDEWQRAKLLIVR